MDRTNIIANTRPSTNLTKQQLHLLMMIRNHPNFIILNTDKNLGPVIIKQEAYIRFIIKEYLNTPTYLQVTQEEALAILSTLEDNISELVRFEYERDLGDNGKIYFQRGLERKQCIPQFYGTSSSHLPTAYSSP